MCIQIGLEQVFIDLFRAYFSRRAVRSQLLGRPGDLVPASVIEGDGEIQSAVVDRRLLQFPDPVLNVVVQRFDISDHADLHIIFRRRLQTGLHIVAQQLHERRHFAVRAVPVLSGKSIDRQVFDAHAPGFLTDPLHVLAALGMPVIPGHPLCLRPASVSVQYDRYMLWYFHRISSHSLIAPARPGRHWKGGLHIQAPFSLYCHDLF